MEKSLETVSLLVVSRDMATLRPLWPFAESHGWHLETATSGWEALERVQSASAPHLTILEESQGDGDSLRILQWLRRVRPELPVILLCHPANAAKKRDALRMGADVVLVGPFQDEQLKFAICRYLAPSVDTLNSEVAIENIESLGGDLFFISASPLMQKLRVQAELLALAEVPVLITGEKGSGKKTAGRLIHRWSVRSEFKLLKVNCAAMPETLLENILSGDTSGVRYDPIQSISQNFAIPEKGTLLLDEITEMPNHLQARLLQFLENNPHFKAENHAESHSAIRILASTSANVERALAERKLRDDLYYRLSTFTLHVPPLRQRKQEIRILLKHFMHKFSKQCELPAKEFPASTIETCLNHLWPGNLTELENFVQRYLLAGDCGVVSDDRDSDHKKPITLSSVLNNDHHDYGGMESELNSRSLKSIVDDIKCEAERNAIATVLAKTGWNRKAASRLLKVSYRTLLYKIDQYHLRASEAFLYALPALQFPRRGAGSNGKGKAS
ncbi:MAG: sigma 54-interacting transcriptional regulator [Candidatus Sulfotelmatobacter sp.]